MTACSSPSVKEVLEDNYYAGRAKPAAYAADGFMVDNNPEAREAKRLEFYYKHCTLVSRERFPSKSSWECTEPY